MNHDRTPTSDCTRLCSGFSLVETVVVMGMSGILIAAISTTLFASHERAELTTGADGVVRDLRDQQTRAMNGVTNPDGSFVDYSVMFEPTRYTLFPGTVYAGSDSRNTVVELDGALRFTDIGFADGIISFARISGDMRQYDPSASSVVLTNTQTNSAMTISVNEKGIVFVQQQ